MKGGGDKVIPTYNVDANDPGIPMEQKELAIKTQPPPQQPLINLQIAQPQKPKNAIQPPLQFLPNTTLYPNNPPLPLGTIQPSINVVNQYVIGDQNPLQNHNKIQMIYEDVLPLKDLPNSLATVDDRIVLLNYIKHIIFKGKDGSDMSLINGTNSLYDRIKSIELNPYHNTFGVFKDNPYQTLPKYMLLYRSCYPIKRDTQTQTSVMCAKESIGMNVRMYRLKNVEIEPNKNGIGSICDHNIWREIEYYNYVLAEIIKRKETPHFVTMIGYSICKDSKIDFEKIETRKNNGIPAIIAPKTINIGGIMKQNPDAYEDNIMVALTESPTYNIVGWASSAYRVSGKAKQMVNTGIHSVDIWRSIIFQILAGLYSMYKHGIHIYNFNLVDNVYIKDLPKTGTITSYWKYIVDGVSYYIPNYGFLVLFDSKYSDIVGSNQKYKMNGNIFKKDDVVFGDDGINNNLNEEIMKLVRKTMNPNIFGNMFTNNNGQSPPSIITHLLGEIFKILNDGNIENDIKIKKCMFDLFGSFMNNRIGTILSKIEQDDIVTTSKDFKVGDIAVYEEGSNIYKFVFVLGTPIAGQIKIMSKNNNNTQSIDVPLGNLYEFTKLKPIVQNYKVNEAKLDDSELLETYVL